MAQSDALKKYLDAGMAFTHLTRAKAEQVVKDLVAAGELQRNQAKTAIDELLDRSRKNAETLAEQVRKEVDEQLASLGLARKSDVEKLEAELARLRGDEGGAKQDAGAEPPAKPAKAKKAAKKAPPKDDEDAGGDKPAEKAAPAKQAAAKKSARSGASTPTRLAATAGTSPVSTELPGRKEKEGQEGGGEGDAKPAPAKKSAKKAAKSGGDGGNGDDRSMPAKKAAKKQG